MAQKKIQKMFYYSSENVKKCIEGRIDDLTVKSQRSASYIIEELLLDGLLPKNREARYIIKNNLYATDIGGVKNTLGAIMDMNAAGTNWNSRYTNFKPLVSYAIKYNKATTLTGEEKQLHHYRRQLRDIVERIENCAMSCIEEYDRRIYEKQANWAKKISEIAENSPQMIDIEEHFQIIYDCWEMLCDWTITYRCLCDLIALSEWDEEVEARNVLYDVICDISDEW